LIGALTKLQTLNLFALREKDFLSKQDLAGWLAMWSGGSVMQLHLTIASVVSIADRWLRRFMEVKKRSVI
jgi:hypothetical protein